MADQLSSGPQDEHREIVIFEEDESGVDGNWDWVATLTVRVDGGRSASLEQVPWERTEDWYNTSYELDPVEDGQELFDFLNSSWAADHFQGIPEGKWAGISSKIETIDPQLGTEIRKAIKDEFDPDPPDVDPDEEAFDQFVRGAVFEKDSRRGGGAMWAGIADNLRSQAAIRRFCRSYLRDHGHLPSGTHRVTCRFGDTPDADMPNPRSGGMGISGSATFDKEVTFPDEQP